jgi:DNA-binding beta-propeller fold protein YncE
MKLVTGRVWLGALCGIVLALGAGATPAQGDSSDPLFLFRPVPIPGEKPAPPPSGYFNGPCGLGVGPGGDLYVSDYYHDAVDVFTSSRTYKGQLANEDPTDGPCGLSFGPGGSLYVNDYHRNVVKFGPFPSFGTGTVIVGAPLDSSHPTGVAVDPVSGNVYVDDRTHIAVHDSAGAPVLDGEGEPLEIGQGSLGEGYGLALSAYPATKGFLYVPDAADGTVKVYDPATDVEDPVATIDGHETSEGEFTSLRDSAVAVDRLTGDVYVADNLQPVFTEEPQAAIWVFGPAGTYKGHLKYTITDANPPGLAVDNTNGFTQGRVYLTTGNSLEAGVYAYPPGAATGGALFGAGFSAASGAQGAASGPDTAVLGRPPAASAPDGASTSGAVATASEIAQKGKLRVAIEGRISPHRLPRRGTAPVAVSVGGRISMTDGSDPPQLKGMRIEFNRSGRLEDSGLPTCPPAKIRIASTKRALSACREALVGTGRFEANVVLAGQAPYPTSGRLLVFNGRKGGKPVLFGHIYSARPFANSFVIEFELGRRAHGTYGTVLSASLPEALGGWGYLTAIEMKLHRRYSYGGRRRSFLSAGCPAPKGFPGALFTLARARFTFAGGQSLSSTLTRNCRARG